MNVRVAFTGFDPSPKSTASVAFEARLTTEHSASSHGQPVLVRESDGAVFGTGDVIAYYLHRVEGADYTPEQEAWIGGLIIAAHVAGPGDRSHHYRFGATWKDEAQLREIEKQLAERGERFYRAG